MFFSLPLFCLVGLIIQIAFIITERKEHYGFAVILKGTASLVFIGIGLLCGDASTDMTLAKWVVAGLILGGIGDVCLNLRFVLKSAGQKVFMGGIAAFLLGHLAYLAALLPPAGKTLFFSLPLGLLAAYLLLKWILAKVSVGKAFKIFGIIYIGAVVLMTAVAIGLLIAKPVTAHAMFAIGAVLFTLSDIILVFHLFTADKKPWMRPTNLTLYYLGQLLIACSLLFF